MTPDELRDTAAMFLTLSASQAVQAFRMLPTAIQTRSALNMNASRLRVPAPERIARSLFDLADLAEPNFI